MAVVVPRREMVVDSMNFLRGAVEWFLPDGQNLDVEQVMVRTIEVGGQQGWDRKVVWSRGVL